MSMLIALDPRGIDLAYPAELERRSGVDAPRMFHDRKLSRCGLTCQVGEKEEGEVDKLHGCCSLRTLLEYA